MGYAIKNMSELNIFDFTQTNGTKENCRKSFDGNYFIVEGENINEYTREEILQEIENNFSIWNPPNR